MTHGRNSQRGLRRVQAVALLCLFTFSSCDQVLKPFRKEVEELARQSLRTANDELDASVGNLEQVIDRQRVALAGDMQTLVQAIAMNMRGLAEQANQSVNAVLATGQSLEARATADLVGSLHSLTVMSRNLTNAVQTGADATIRAAAQEFDRQRTITLNQLNTATQDVLRPMLAQFKVVGGHLVGQAESAISRALFLIAGAAVLLAAAIALGIGLVRKVKGAIIGAPLTGLVGLGLLLFSAPLSRLGQPQITLPSPDALCAEMTQLAAKLEPFERPRQARGLEAAATALAARPRVLAHSLRMSLRAPEAPAVAAPTDRIGIATALLSAANQCVVWSPTSGMAELARRNFTRALAQLGDTVFCRSAADCAVLGKACDAFMQVCLDWGVYCDNHSDCASGMSCETNRRRCIPDSGRACATPNDCGAGSACDRRVARCLPIAEIQAKQEVCVVLDARPNSPCQAGVVGVDAQRWVQCLQTGTAGDERCDGVDNNCNGATDEGYVRAPGCNEGTGACRFQGTWTCVNGAEVCALRAPQPEVCDGQDNDCNGTVDDAPPQGACNAAAQGVCAKGTLYCNGRCVPGAASPEVCDGQDNDCNGVVDQQGACGIAPIWTQGPDDNGKELTRSPRLPTDLINTLGIAGPASCGEDEHGRRFSRNDVQVSAHSPHGASCEFVSWVDPSPFDCRINVRFKTIMMGSNAWCSASWTGSASGPWVR